MPEFVSLVVDGAIGLPMGVALTVLAMSTRVTSPESTQLRRSALIQATAIVVLLLALLLVVHGLLPAASRIGLLAISWPMLVVSTAAGFGLAQLIFGLARAGFIRADDDGWPPPSGPLAMTLVVVLGLLGIAGGAVAADQLLTGPSQSTTLTLPAGLPPLTLAHPGPRISVPTLQVATPDRLGQGAGFMKITLTGAALAPGGQLSIAGSGITVNAVTWVSSSQLNVNLTVAPSADPRPRNVDYMNPDGGRATCRSCLTITPGPTLGQLNPQGLTVGATKRPISIVGSGFMTGASLNFLGGGVSIASSSVTTSDSLDAVVNVSSSAATGKRGVSVTNPDGGTAMCESCFTVYGFPTITRTYPQALSAGAANQSVTAIGSGFQSGAGLRIIPADDLTVTSPEVQDPSHIGFIVSIDSRATSGKRDVVVITADGVSAIPCRSCFTVNQPPFVTSVPSSPVTYTVGTTQHNEIRLVGSGFATGMSVSFSHSPARTSSDASVQTTRLSIQSSSIAVVDIDIMASSVSTFDIKVTNPDGGWSVCRACLALTPPVPK